MTTARLTSRQRVQRMMDRQDHDRIPRHDGYWPETLQRWQREGGPGATADALTQLNNDITGICWSWPVPFPGHKEILAQTEQTQDVRDSMGRVVRVWKQQSGTPEHLSFGCDSYERWRTTYAPALRVAPPTVDPAQSLRSSQRDGQAGLYRTLRSPDPFESMRQLVGDEIVLPAMALEPQWIVEMSNLYTDLYLRDYQAILDAGAQAEALWVYGDVGYNHGTFFSPAMYRQLIWPDHVRMCQWAHARGLKFIYHTDGDVRGFMDLFVEGQFDCLQPLEAKANMDVRQLSPSYGGQLSFMGNIDATVLSAGDRARIEHEVLTKLAAGMQQRGYCYHSDHSVPPGVSWSTYRCLIELLDRHGNYT